MTQWRAGALIILFGLIGLLPLQDILRWQHGGPIPPPKAFLATSCLLLIPLGLLIIANALRGLPRFIVDARGISVKSVFGTKWADWDSVGPFAIKTIDRFKIKQAIAKVNGPNANQKIAKPVLITNHYAFSLEEIVDDLNATRAQSLGMSHAEASAAVPVDSTSVGLPGFRIPWLTFALLAILIGVFALEWYLPVMPPGKEGPSIVTVAAMGAMNHAAIVGGEWYRLFMAPLLHASVPHLIGNGVALLLGGWMLERLVGRLWFFVFFAVSALTGSLVSFAAHTGGQISVGASGALMGMFAGLFVSSFRISSEDSSRRTRLQLNSLRILIPALIPSFSGGGIRIDYGSHFGGAIGGAVLALILLRYWPKTAAIPQARRTAAIAAAIAALLFLGSAAVAAIKYEPYRAALTARLKSPPTTAPAAGASTANPSDTASPGNGPGGLQSCAAVFPKGAGAIPGINCRN